MASDLRLAGAGLALAVAATVAHAGAGGCAQHDEVGPPTQRAVQPLRGARWTSATDVPHARAGHSAIQTIDGRVGIAGGVIGETPLGFSAVYDPGTNLWTSTGVILQGRVFNGTDRLTDGRMVLVGGQLTGKGFLAHAELGDPLLGSFSAIGELSAPRANVTITTLLDGRVLAAGGFNPSAVATTETWDPSTGEWTAAPAMGTPRGLHSATRLLDGRVLVAGGTTGSGPSGAEVFDPMSAAWTPTGPMKSARSFHTATLLADGRVLVVGGIGSTVLKTAEVFDPVAGSWEWAGSMVGARALHAAARLSDGRVLVAGGIESPTAQNDNYIPGLASTEVYDPVADSWADAGAMAQGRAFHTATTLGTGQVLVVAGVRNVLVQGGGLAIENTEVIGSSELFTPQLRAQGAPCTIGSQCETGFCADQVCCDTPCEAGGCTACSLASGAKQDGTCVALSLPGCSVQPCKVGSDCATGFCADGICCDSACEGACRSCLIVPGTCTIAPEATDPRRDCHAGADACVATCDGEGACRPADVGTQCVPSGCATETEAIVPSLCSLRMEVGCVALPEGGFPAGCLECDAAAATSESCLPYRCDAEIGACRTNCRSVRDCAPGRVCAPDGACIEPPPPPGGDEVGCAAGRRPPSTSHWHVWVVVALFAIRPRRRQARN